jgi:hypothetical protein
MSESTVARWRRYGHDRWYVTAADGTKIGHWDAKTGEHHPEPGHDDHLLTALAQHRATTGLPEGYPDGRSLDTPPPSPPPAMPPPAETPSPSVEAATPPTGPPPPQHWDDLADRAPGGKAREQAQRLAARAPVRTLIARVLDVKTDERAWRIGADGEQMMAKELAKLDGAWRTLHAVPIGNRGSDIDHVLIGPGGVFTINAKHHPGAMVTVSGDTIRINDTRQPYVRNSRYEAARASELLSRAAGYPLTALGIVAFVRVTDIKVKAQPARDVVALGRFEIRPWLAQRATVLTPEQVDEVYAVARRSDTWRD